MSHLPSASLVNREDGLLPLIPVTSAKLARRNYSSLQTLHFRVKRYFFIIEPGSRSNFAFKASFTSLNVAKVTMKEMGMEYFMSSFKSLMTNTYLVRRIFKACGYNPNRTLISKIFKDLSCLQRIAA